MKKLRVQFTGVLVILVSMGFTPKQKVAQSNGKDLYAKHCKSCHGKNGDGGLFNLYPPLTDATWVGNDTLIVSNIVNGLSGEITVNGKTYDKEMPKVVGLSNQEVAEIINYVRASFTEIEERITAQKVKDIKAL